MGIMDKFNEDFMYKICFYAPESHMEQIKNAMFESGAGKIGEYSHCAWQVLGEGQFMPLKGSNAFIGEVNELEKTPEYKIEMICDDKYLRDVIFALKKTHPYEQPAYQVFKMENF